MKIDNGKLKIKKLALKGRGSTPKKVARNPATFFLVYICSDEAIKAPLTNPSLSGERMTDNDAVPSSVPLRRARQPQLGMPS